MPYCFFNSGIKVCQGFIKIVFPTSLTVDASAYCYANITETSMCIVDLNNITLYFSDEIPAGTSFAVTVSKVKNSPNLGKTGSFKIYSYYDDLYDSLVDQI
jgi:hypothetical protein